MARFKGETEETIVVNAPLEEAKAHFRDLQMIAKHNKEMESCTEVDDETLHFVLVPQEHKAVTFRGDYVCRYTLSGDTLTWRSIESNNIWVSGKAEFFDAGGNKTRIRYYQSLELEMDVNRLLAKVIAPLAKKGMRKGVKTYLNDMKEALERR